MPASDNLDEQPSLQQWVADTHISEETLKLLEKDGFTCTEKEDISHKITRGQQKLILKAVSEMPENRKASAPVETDQTGQESQKSVDPYVRDALQQLQKAQGATNRSGTETSTPQLGGILSGPGPMSTERPLPNDATWANPQIFLKMAAGKAGHETFYDIVDFIYLYGAVQQDEVVGSGQNGAQLIWKNWPTQAQTLLGDTASMVSGQFSNHVQAHGGREADRRSSH